MFSQRIPLTDLIDLCRVLRHQLSAGLSIQKVMQQQAQRGRRSVRRVAGCLSESLQKGNSLSDSLEPHQDVFPPLFFSMVHLGETSGHLAEIFGELERYYQLELQLRRQFRSQTFMPILQFVAAVFVLAGLIFILGMIAGARNSAPLLTIFGLSGASGSLAFLGVVFGSIALIWLVYNVLASIGQQKAWLDRLFLGLPAVGPCLRALVMSRFTLALQMTLDTGLSINKALRLCLNATGNAHFASRADTVVLALKGGDTLHESLAASGLFDETFLDMVASAEISGRVPEMMRVQAQQYHEEAALKMKTLTMLAGMGVWAISAAFIIWAIFKLAFIYLGALGA